MIEIEEGQVIELLGKPNDQEVSFEKFRAEFMAELAARIGA